MLEPNNEKYITSAIPQFESAYNSLSKSLKRRPTREEVLEEINQTRSKNKEKPLDIRQLDFVMRRINSVTESGLDNTNQSKFPLNRARPSGVYPETIVQTYKQSGKKSLRVPPTAEMLTAELNKLAGVKITLDAVSKFAKELGLIVTRDQPNFIIGIIKKIYPELQQELKEAAPTKKQLTNKINQLGFDFSETAVMSALTLLRKNQPAYKDWKFKRTDPVNYNLTEKEQTLAEVYSTTRKLGAEIPKLPTILKLLTEHDSGLFSRKNYQQERYLQDGVNKMILRSKERFLKAGGRHLLIKGVSHLTNLISLYENVKELEAIADQPYARAVAKGPAINFRGLPPLVENQEDKIIANNFKYAYKKAVLYTAHALCLDTCNKKLGEKSYQSAEKFSATAIQINPSLAKDPELCTGYFLTLILAARQERISADQAKSILVLANSTNPQEFLFHAHQCCLRLIRILD